MRPSVPVLAVLAALLATAVPAEAAKKPRLQTPGYKGVTKAPKLAPQQPLTPVQVAAQGEKPQVLVDAAGTAHIVWNERRGADQDVTRYCRLKRGARACDARADLIPPLDTTDAGNSPQANADFEGPKVIALGDELGLLTRRSFRTTAPDGQSTQSPLYLYLSQDGGTTFNPPAMVGTGPLSGEPAVFGAQDAPRIGLISDTATGGPFFQAISPGRFTRAQVSFGGDGIDASVTRNGDLPVVAYRDLNNTTFVKTWTGQGDINDANTWTTATIPATDDPLLASGPMGVYLMTAPASGAHTYAVRRFTPPSSFGPAVKVGAGNATRRDLFQDRSGRLFATYVSNEGDVPQLLAQSSTDARTWSARRALVNGPRNGDVWTSDIGATGDGGGFAVAQVAAGGAEGPIVAARFGEGAATGQPGLGSLAGGAADPTVVERCQRIEFASVDIVAPEGCLLSAADRKGVKVSEGMIKLNGIELIPDPGVKILLDARARTIDSTGRVTMQLRAPGISPVVLSRDALHLRLPGGSRASAAASGSEDCSGDSLIAFDAGKNKLLKGFPIRGSIEIFLKDDASCIPLSLELPKAFGGIRGAAVLAASNTRGLHAESLDIKANTIPIGPVLIQDLRITYKAAGEEWTGGARLTFPPGWTAGGSVKFRDGEFRGATITLGFYPGIPVFTGVFLNRVTAGFEVDPLKLTAEARFGSLPLKPPDTFGIVETGRLEATFGKVFVLKVKGNAEIFEVDLLQAEATIRSDLYFDIKATLNLDLEVIEVEGSAEIFIDGPNEQFGGEVSAKARIFGLTIGNAEAILSSKALALCGPSPIPFIDGGFVIVWGKKAEPLWGDCDLEEYKVGPGGSGRGARAAQAGTITVPGGTPTASLRITGTGGVPAVVVVSPSGERITPSRAGGEGVKAVAVDDPSENATYVAMPKPAPGNWRVEAAPGSVPIAEVASANALPDPTVSATLRAAAGRTRALRWKFPNARGRTVSFVEEAGAGVRVIGRGTGAGGTVRFDPGEGPAGKRTIFAVVSQDDVPRHRIELASYTSPGPPKPGRVTKPRTRRTRNAITVSWGAARGVAQYVVRADVSDGRRLAFTTTRRSLRIPDIAKTDRVTVRIQARGRNGQLGPAARATPRR